MNIKFTKSSYKDYGNLPSNYKKLIDKSLTHLKSGNSSDFIPVKGKKDVYRLRVGKYRVLILKISNDLIITGIKKRNDAYKKKI